MIRRYRHEQGRSDVEPNPEGDLVLYDDYRDEVKSLREQRDTLWDAFIQDLVGHDTRCKKCGGLGRRMYSSTSTWRGGIGGQAMTTDVCNGCWGSGSATRPWPSHREFYAMKKAKEKAQQ